MKKIIRVLGTMVLAVLTAGLVVQVPVHAAVENGWEVVDGNAYWYENGVKQGTEGRGKEIYDPGSNAWYWLDAVDGGRMAKSKDVYQESKADDEGNMGKWVRYDGEGHMVKGWNMNQNGIFYFDWIYGTMAKGYTTIDGTEYYFNVNTGILERNLGKVPEFGWKNIDGNDYWYEGHVRQGYSINPSYRGKEIYDPFTDAWYWLDNIDGGKKAVSKDVYQESEAGDWGDYTDGYGTRYGKWVRYDSEGHMVKGFDRNANGTYYFDPIYGTMAKGGAVIDGVLWHFNVTTGIQDDSDGCNLESYSRYYKFEYAYKWGNTSVLSAEDMAFYNGLKACLDEACRYQTPYEQELAVHDYIVLNCEYDYDNYLNDTIPDVSYSAEGVFVNRTAVCAGYTEAFQLCMDILGIPCIEVSGMAYNSGEEGGLHGWNAVQLEGEWYMVDVTWDDPVPDREGRVYHTYFNVTDEYLKKDHEYTCEISAKGTKYNYSNFPHPL